MRTGQLALSTRIGKQNEVLAQEELTLFPPTADTMVIDGGGGSWRSSAVCLLVVSATRMPSKLCNPKAHKKKKKQTSDLKCDYEESPLESDTLDYFHLLRTPL